jgi:hypothetical protein
VAVSRTAAIKADATAIASEPALTSFAAALRRDLNQWLGPHALRTIKTRLASDALNITFLTSMGPISFGALALVGGVMMDNIPPLDGSEADERTSLLQREARTAADRIFVPVAMDEPNIQGAIVHVVRLATVRNQALVRAAGERHPADAAWFGRWCAIGVLMYTLSPQCAREADGYIHDCLAGDHPDVAAL